MIFWRGESSDDYRVIVERYPSRPVPRRKFEAVSVPGRNGDILYAQDAYENVTQVYEVYLSAEKQGLPMAARKAAGWLSAPGYHRLEDSYDPYVFRCAYFPGGQDIENVLNMFGRATLEFVCKPQRFLKAGEAAQAFTSDGVLVNPSAMTAAPIIRIYGAGTVTVAGIEVTVTSNPGYIDLDSDLLDAFMGKTNCNGFVELSEFPTLPAGESTVELGSGITGIEITPRWWIL